MTRPHPAVMRNILLKYALYCTRNKVLICALYCIANAAAARADLRSLVSPGPLARPHAAFDKQCDKCHVPFKGIPTANCLACHARVAEQLKTGHGSHTQWSDRKCSACHGDHKGRDHQLSPPVEHGYRSLEC